METELEATLREATAVIERFPEVWPGYDVIVVANQWDRKHAEVTWAVFDADGDWIADGRMDAPDADRALTLAEEALKEKGLVAA